ncbi:rasGEF domain-containing protein [Reticulomyxa filosa]|uniref:RasGEF domain-containing protein n=1 Tax=Reticulomyxa filosa TaxID=46433 RepID=X6PE59_RETFI|nr:rasGEF domain-containing protein [Reticulomyxa filosa]|eukprot:ETO36795.1 rasGEF domain-containing protein [Reticulomyxa filosa]
MTILCSARSVDMRWNRSRCLLPIFVRTNSSRPNKSKKKKATPRKETINARPGPRERSFTDAIPANDIAISASGTVKQSAIASKTFQFTAPSESNTPEHTVESKDNTAVVIVPLDGESDSVVKNKNVEWTVPDLTEPSITITPSHSQAETETLKFEDDLEAEQDRFQVSELIWGLTHEDNKDDSVKDVLLLCHQSFSTSMHLWQCLAKRFLHRNWSRASMSFSLSTNEDPSFYAGPDVNGSNTMSPRTGQKESKLVGMDALWPVQVKVTNLLQHWMRLYWNEDFATQPDLVRSVLKFIELVDYNLDNDQRFDDATRKKTRKLLAMVQQTIETQDKQFQKKTQERESKVIFSKQKSVKMLGMDQEAEEFAQDFIKVDNQKIAEQLTLLDFEIFKQIKPRECIGQAWKKENKIQVAPNICKFIDQFNRISKYIQASILNAPDAKKRGRLIKKFLKLSNVLYILLKDTQNNIKNNVYKHYIYELFTLHNFQSLCAVHGALTSVPIHKLKTAWKFVPNKHLARFEELKVIFRTAHNMSNLRKIHREACAPMIPYTGIFLSDLVSIEEGTRQRKDDGTVNFSKLIRLNSQIENSLLYQKTLYSHAKHPSLYNFLEKVLQSQDQIKVEELYNLATEVAKQDAKANHKRRFFGHSTENFENVVFGFCCLFVGFLCSMDSWHDFRLRAITYFEKIISLCSSIYRKRIGFLQENFF